MYNIVTLPIWIGRFNNKLITVLRRARAMAWRLPLLFLTEIINLIVPGMQMRQLNF